LLALNLNPTKVPFAAAMEIICTAIDDFLQQLASSGLQAPQAVSIAIGGPLNIAEGILHSPPTWRPGEKRP